MKRAALATTILVVTGAAVFACSSEPPGPLPPISLPSRTRDAGRDAPGVLEPTDADVPEDTGPPPNVFCTEAGIVGCFEFEDSIVDGSGTLTSSTTATFKYEDGHKGRAIHLEGVNSIVFPFSSVLNMKAVTVEAWLYRSLAAVGVDTVFDDGERFAMSLLDDGTVRCKANGTSATGGSITVEKWTHVACVFDGTKVRVYVGGAETGSVAGSPGESATAGAVIGNNVADGNEGFSGLIDSLRIFGVARTPTQIVEAAK